MYVVCIFYIRMMMYVARTGRRTASFQCAVALCSTHCKIYRAKVEKSARRMPWLTEAMKDVISCDKPRVGANIL